MKRNVYLVDDHALVREGLAKLIAQEPDLQVCAEASTAAQALEGVEHLRPDVVVVDLSLAGESGLDLIKQLQERPSPPPILVLSMHDEALYAERALRAGARGYVMKRESTSRTIAAIREVLSGRLYLSGSAASQLAERIVGLKAGQTTSPVDLLSDRELEIFRRIGEGQSNRQIADDLHLSLKTVQTHCAHMKDKFGLANGTLLIREAVRWAEQQSPN